MEPPEMMLNDYFCHYVRQEACGQAGWWEPRIRGAVEAGAEQNKSKAPVAHHAMNGKRDFIAYDCFA
jgi:hypothetical protein